MDPFVLTLPDAPAGPVIVEVPHAGLYLPDAIEKAALLRADEALKDADPYVDRLVAEAPAHHAALLRAQVSRYVVDLNRAPDDVSREVIPDHPDPKATQSRGVVWTTSTDGRALWRTPLDFRELSARLMRYHRPYHQALADQIALTHARHGYVILLCVHSMPSTARSGRRADVVPGTRGRSTAASRVIDAVDAHFRAHHLSVRHDDPYRGGYTTGLWGRPDEGIHAVQIELSRALYIDERTLALDPRGVAEISGVMHALIDRLGQLPM